MRSGGVVTVAPEDRGRLEAIVPDRGRANRLKALGGFAPFQAVCKAWIGKDPPQAAACPPLVGTEDLATGLIPR